MVRSSPVPPVSKVDLDYIRKVRDRELQPCWMESCPGFPDCGMLIVVVNLTTPGISYTPSC